jgi:N-methylhydantoinase A
MTWRVGVDIGGTFIDFCALDEQSGTLHTLKVLTTPADPGQEVMDGITLLQDRHGMDPADVTAFVHGTTVGINTIIQRKGANLALLTTAGFEDVVELARLRMPNMQSLFCTRPDPLVPRDRIFGIGGRVLSDGSVLETLDAAAVRAAAIAARQRGATGVIIAFLNSYRNAAQEQEAAAILHAEAPDLFVFTSAAIWPVIREYERTTTAILNGYVHPRVAGYLTSLELALEQKGVAARPMVTKSNGGVMGTGLGKTSCVSMLLSGTASGVMGAAFLARQAGLSMALTLDIGGTSADVALVMDGQPLFGSGETVGEFPLFIPSVSVTSIGDGGGSIATVDGFGVLKVGPESAGSTPGPACYGRGGDRATITDAMAVCGWLGHTPLAYRSVAMDRSRADDVVGRLATAMGLSLRQAAEAIIRVTVSNMFMEVNKLIGRYGVDPAEFCLMPFGGAGPMLGCLLARELGMRSVMVPRRPGVVSALGGLIAAIKNDFVLTLLLEVDASTAPALIAAEARLRQDAETWLRDDQGFHGPAEVTLLADMRYAGQSFEIEVKLDAAWVQAGDMAAVAAAFHRQHSAIYEFADTAADVQLVNLRLVIAGATAPPDFPRETRVEGVPSKERDVEVWQDGALQSVPLYLRDSLHHGHRLAGPAIIAQEDTTVCIPQGFDGAVDALGNLHLTAVAA